MRKPHSKTEYRRTSQPRTLEGDLSKVNDVALGVVIAGQELARRVPKRKTAALVAGALVVGAGAGPVTDRISETVSYNNLSQSLTKPQPEVAQDLIAGKIDSDEIVVVRFVLPSAGEEGKSPLHVAAKNTSNHDVGANVPQLELSVEGSTTTWDASSTLGDHNSTATENLRGIIVAQVGERAAVGETIVLPRTDLPADLVEQATFVMNADISKQAQ